MTSNTVKNAEKLHHLPMGKTTLDDKLTVSYKVKHVFITWPSDCALKKLPRKIKTDVHTKAPSTHAHNSFTCDGWEAAAAGTYGTVGDPWLRLVRKEKWICNNPEGTPGNPQSSNCITRFDFSSHWHTVSISIAGWSQIIAIPLPQPPQNLDGRHVPQCLTIQDSWNKKAAEKAENPAGAGGGASGWCPFREGETLGVLITVMAAWFHTCKSSTYLSGLSVTIRIPPLPPLSLKPFNGCQLLRVKVQIQHHHPFLDRSLTVGQPSQ